MTGLATPQGLSNDEGTPLAVAGRLFGQLDNAKLREQGLLHDAEPGFVRVHKRRLSRFSDEEHGQLPISPESNTTTEDAYARVPTHLVTYNSLLHLGLTKTKANSLWQEWSNWPAAGPSRFEVDPDDGGLQVGFLDFVLGHTVESLADVIDDNDAEWVACLRACGFGESLEHALMDPAFKRFRLTESCLFWAQDTLKMRYAALEEIQETSRQREMYLRRAASRAGHGQGQQSGDHPKTLDLAAGAFSSTTSGARSISNQQLLGTAGFNTRIHLSASDFDAKNASGFTTLYRGQDKARISRLFNEAGDLDSLDPLRTYTPSDFRSPRFYFTPDYEIAFAYAAWAKRRVGNSGSSVIVCIRVSNAAIETLDDSQLKRIYWPDADWRQLVWVGRTGRKVPKDLKKYRDALLLVGTVAREPNEDYIRMDSWEQVNERHILRVGKSRTSRPAVQYAFSDEAGEEFLEEHVRDPIEIIACSRADLERWEDIDDPDDA